MKWYNFIYLILGILIFFSWKAGLILFEDAVMILMLHLLYYIFTINVSNEGWIKEELKYLKRKGE